MYDIAVIGGGASGFASAISAKQTNPNINVAIVEKMFRSGKKLLATGNGKCNLSNLDISEKNYHGSINAMQIISNTPDYKEFFTDNLGVLCSFGNEGRKGGIYPRSNSANTVLNALRLKMLSLGIEEICDFEVKEICPEKDGFVLKSKHSQLEAKKIIVACGGYAGTSFGTDGSMLRILKNMGFKTAKICPAVAPLKVNPDEIKGLKGVRIKCNVSAVSGKNILRTESGEMQFNENNLSGICVFNLAYLFGQYEGNLKIRTDLAPDMSKEETINYIKDVKLKRSEFPAEELLTGMFVKSLAVYLVKKVLGRNLNDPVKTISENEIIRLSDTIKNLEFEVTGCSGWQNAQATYGGIHKDCINKNLESVAFKGMYFCGEILDTVGDCGGYNLQWAWSSGIWAGKKCAESLR